MAEPTMTVVIGGTRSGKSAVAESLLAGAPAVTYVATGAADDPEMADRVQMHRERRPAHWTTVETAEVGAAIREAAGAVLIDSVGAWVRARMDDGGLWEEGDLQPIIDDASTWADAVRTGGGPVVIVAEQVGAGVVPTGRGTRRWVDTVGAVTSALADRADRALLVVAGGVVPLQAARAAIALDVDPDARRPMPLGTQGPTPDRPSQAAPAVVVADDLDRLHAHGDVMVPEGALDLAVNVRAEGPPEHVRRALRTASAGRYPDQAQAREAVAARHGLSPDNVVLLAGAAEAFWLVPHALNPRRAALVHPSFTAPEAALRTTGADIVRVPRDAATGWTLRTERVPDDADLVVVGNPNNPTGTLDEPSALVSLCQDGRVVVVDEAFMDFVVDGRSSLAGAVRDRDLIVVRSVTKMWSVPGVRAGYLTAPAHLAERLRAHQQPWPVSAHALAVIVASVADERWRLEAAAEVVKHRAVLVRRMQDITGVVVHDGAANFILLEVESGPAVHRALLARGVAVRPSTFPLLPPRFLRVTVQDAHATERLAAALLEIL